MSRFKIIIDGYEVTDEMLEKWNDLQWSAYEFGLCVDPESLTIVPVREQTKYWESGDRQPSDYEGGKWPERQLEG